MDKNYQNVLSKLKKGEKAIIKGFSNENIPVKLFEMGFLPGVELKLLFTALFSNLFCITYGKDHCCLILRKNEAKNIFIERIS